MSERLMGRSVSSEMSEHVRSVHLACGIDILLGTPVASFDVDKGRIKSVHLAAQTLPCDLLLVAIGAEPETSLALGAGLDCDNGILVDATLATSDASIFAIGDCASFPTASGTRLRLESVQNANDQAKTVAARLAGEDASYRPVPWFWSEQGALRLQMVGLLPPRPRSFRRAGAQPGSLSLFHFDGERLACVESINAPMDHMVSRRLLEAGGCTTPEQVTDSEVPLKALLTP
jgi:3-phenylpropionate/trans-cinnamate dioxygenase ferredoxin reductase component